MLLLPLPRMGVRKGTAWTEAVERQEDWRETAEEEEEREDVEVVGGPPRGVRAWRRDEWLAAVNCESVPGLAEVL